MSAASVRGSAIWRTLTKERQAWCCLQVKLCDPCLSALGVCVLKWRYINTLLLRSPTLDLYAVHLFMYCQSFLIFVLHSSEILYCSCCVILNVSRFTWLRTCLYSRNIALSLVEIYRFQSLCFYVLCSLLWTKRLERLLILIYSQCLHYYIRLTAFFPGQPG